MSLILNRKFLTQTAFASAFIGLIALPSAAAAEPGKHAPMPPMPPHAIMMMPRITVEAEGSASAKPDMALLQVSVAHDGKTAKSALDGVNQGMQTLLAALKKQLPEADIQTSDFTLNPVYRQDDDAKSKPQKIFQASAVLALKIRKSDAVGTIIDTAMNNGATSVSNLVWTNSDLKSLYTAARKQAIANALDEANAYAEAAGAKVGRVIRITEMPEFGGHGPRLLGGIRAAAMSDNTEMAEGENSYKVHVSVTYRLITKKPHDMGDKNSDSDPKDAE